MQPIILIPARLGSTRLPGKVLVDIAGKPMIVRVWEAAQAAGLGPVVVACDDLQIQQAVVQAGGQGVLTPPELPSGSDRIWHALNQIDPAGHHDVVINLQGDLPTLDPVLIRETLIPLAHGFDIGTLSVLLEQDAEAARPDIVKIAMAQPRASGVCQALYFSRALIPHGGPYDHHIGLYAYQRHALQAFIAAPPAPLEIAEKLEQLRALDLGLTIGVQRVKTLPLGVDTAQDLEQARMFFQKSY